MTMIAFYIVFYLKPMIGPMVNMSTVIIITQRALIKIPGISISNMR